MVDKDGITCSYKDGLLRILVPMKPPSMPTDDQLSTRVTTLEQELKDAEARDSVSSSLNTRHRLPLHTRPCALKTE